MGKRLRQIRQSLGYKQSTVATLMGRRVFRAMEQERRREGEERKRALETRKVSPEALGKMQQAMVELFGELENPAVGLGRRIDPSPESGLTDARRQRRCQSSGTGPIRQVERPEAGILSTGNPTRKPNSGLHIRFVDQRKPDSGGRVHGRR